MYKNGNEIAKIIKENLKIYFSKNLKTLAIISIGDNKISQNYINFKIKDANEINVNTKHYNFNCNISFNELKENILKISNDDLIDGIILQLPLPSSLKNKTQQLLDLIPLKKDVDALNSAWITKRYLKQKTLYPATPMAVINYLEYNYINYQGENIAIVGASNLVGRPLSQYLLNKRATPIILQSKSNLDVCKCAKIVIVAVGKQGILKPEHINENCIIIDVGTNYVEGKLVGDVSKLCLNKAKYVSPVPGGIGPLTRINIFENLRKLDLWDNI